MSFHSAGLEKQMFPVGLESDNLRGDFSFMSSWRATIYEVISLL
jgi:hypothetical protein